MKDIFDIFYKGNAQDIVDFFDDKYPLDNLWKGRTLALIEPISEAAIYLRDNNNKKITPHSFLTMLRFKNILELFNSKSLPGTIQFKIGMFLTSLPEYDVYKGQYSKKTEEYYEYIRIIVFNIIKDNIYIAKNFKTSLIKSDHYTIYEIVAGQMKNRRSSCSLNDFGCFDWVALDMSNSIFQVLIYFRDNNDIPITYFAIKKALDLKEIVNFYNDPSIKDESIKEAINKYLYRMFYQYNLTYDKQREETYERHNYCRSILEPAINDLIKESFWHNIRSSKNT